MEKLNSMELELARQTAYLSAGASYKAQRKAAEKVAQMTGTEVDEELQSSRGKSTFTQVFGGGSRSGTPRRVPS
jgi:hypothetical protein